MILVLSHKRSFRAWLVASFVSRSITTRPTFYGALSWRSLISFSSSTDTNRSAISMLVRNAIGLGDRIASESGRCGAKRRHDHRSPLCQGALDHSDCDDLSVRVRLSAALPC